MKENTSTHILQIQKKSDLCQNKIQKKK